MGIRTTRGESECSPIWAPERAESRSLEALAVVGPVVTRTVDTDGVTEMIKMCRHASRACATTIRKTKRTSARPSLR